MIRKLIKKLTSDTPKAGVDELQQIYDEIEAQKQRIAQEKAKIKEEHQDGSRLTKHRFTI